MNHYSQLLENGRSHLIQLRLEAYIARSTPTQPSLRRRIANALKNWAAKLENEQQLVLP